MIITNETTAWQIAELMGPAADDQDGEVMRDLISREGESDTDAISDDRWIELLNEAQEIRRGAGYWHPTVAGHPSF